MMHFCWLPPLRLVIGASSAGGLHAELLRRVCGHAAVRGARLIKPAAAGFVERADRDVLADGHLRRTGPAACGLRSPGRCRPAGLARDGGTSTGSAVQHDPPVRRLGGWRRTGIPAAPCGRRPSGRRCPGFRRAAARNRRPSAASRGRGPARGARGSRPRARRRPACGRPPKSTASISRPTIRCVTSRGRGLACGRASSPAGRRGAR